ncbi:MAG: hypothetical protein N3G20_06130 [Verrucomicrobiae bacterium]|nr:hypothetical protein [Verrucomicrobiae bacterium]
MKSHRWQNANVVATVGDSRWLWQFKRSGSRVELESSKTLALTSKLPPSAVTKTVRDLWQPRLNVAWLPANQVFVRVVHLPPCEPSEVPAMLEFQIEKLCPLPLAQAVWTAHVMPGRDNDVTTAIVIMVPRSFVEQYLGELEGIGYIPDRLDVPFLAELLSVSVEGDEVWVHARREAGKIISVVAWWNEGKLVNLNLFQLPNDLTAASHLVEFLRQTAWAGEMEGWLPDNPKWHLMSDSTIAAEFQAALTDFIGFTPQLHRAPEPQELAAVAIHLDTTANLLPAEHMVRYRQQFVDRLWMRGLGGVALIYLACVVVFMAVLQYLGFQKTRVEREVAEMAGSYTNALQLKAKIAVLEEQMSLKFAALDCWKCASEALPQELTLTQLSFQRGKKLGLYGTGPPDQQTKVTEFNEALSKCTVNGRPLFSQVTTRSIQGGGVGAGNRPMNWNIECEIKRSDL